MSGMRLFLEKNINPLIICFVGKTFAVTGCPRILPQKDLKPTDYFQIDPNNACSHWITLYVVPKMPISLILPKFNVYVVK